MPFHGTPLRKTCEDLGLIKPETITKCVTTDDTQISMPQYTPQEIKEVIRTFNMYVKFPKHRWPEIKDAETNIELREKLSEEYIKTFWSKSSAKIEDDIADAAKGLF